MSLDDTVLIEHMYAECRKITDLTARISYQQYMEDYVYQDALIRQLEILGEAAGQLSPEFCALHPGIKVSDMKGFRNVLAHQYFAVDVKIVWKIALHDVPELMTALSRFVANRHPTAVD